MVTPLARLWRDSATVTGYEDFARADHTTGKREVVLIEDVPCKLSYASAQAATQTETGAAVFIDAKIFLSNNITIPTGSKITVTHFGDTTKWKQSGLPGVYSTHQEIAVEPWKGWAS